MSEADREYDRRRERELQRLSGLLEGIDKEIVRIFKYIETLEERIKGLDGKHEGHTKELAVWMALRGQTIDTMEKSISAIRGKLAAAASAASAAERPPPLLQAPPEATTVRSIFADKNKRHAAFAVGGLSVTGGAGVVTFIYALEKILPIISVWLNGK